MNFEEHIRFLLFFLIVLIIVFVIAFTLEIQKLWLSTLGSVAVIGYIIIILARSDDEIGQTD